MHQTACAFLHRTAPQTFCAQPLTAPATDKQSTVLKSAPFPATTVLKQQTQQQTNPPAEYVDHLSPPAGAAAGVDLQEEGAAELPLELPPTREARLRRRPSTSLARGAPSLVDRSTSMPGGRERERGRSNQEKHRRGVSKKRWRQARAGVTSANKLSVLAQGAVRCTQQAHCTGAQCAQVVTCCPCLDSRGYTQSKLVQTRYYELRAHTVKSLWRCSLPRVRWFRETPLEIRPLTTLSLVGSRGSSAPVFFTRSLRSSMRRWPRSLAPSLAPAEPLPLLPREAAGLEEL